MRFLAATVMVLSLLGCKRPTCENATQHVSQMIAATPRPKFEPPENIEKWNRFYKGCEDGLKKGTVTEAHLKCILDAQNEERALSCMPTL